MAKPEEDSYAREPYVFEPLDTRARFEADGAHENLGRVYVILKQVSAKSETTWLESAGVPASFPDEAEVKLVRRAKLTCVHSPVTCSLVLVSEETVRSVN